MIKQLLNTLGLIDKGYYYSNRKLSSLSKKELKKVIWLTIWYCRYELGTNPRRIVPNVVLQDNYHDEIYYGEYEPTDNEIVVFINELKTLGQLTSVIVHEYTHYLQPIVSKYYKLLKEHGYKNHPFEIEARENERVHNRRVLNYLRQNMPKYVK